MVNSLASSWALAAAVTRTAAASALSAIFAQCRSCCLVVVEQAVSSEQVKKELVYVDWCLVCVCLALHVWMEGRAFLQGEELSNLALLYLALLLCPHSRSLALLSPLNYLLFYQTHKHTHTLSPLTALVLPLVRFLLFLFLFFQKCTFSSYT